MKKKEDAAVRGICARLRSLEELASTKAGVDAPTKFAMYCDLIAHLRVKGGSLKMIKLIEKFRATIQMPEESVEAAIAALEHQADGYEAQLDAAYSPFATACEAQLNQIHTKKRSGSYARFDELRELLSVTCLHNSGNLSDVITMFDHLAKHYDEANDPLSIRVLKKLQQSQKQYDAAMRKAA